MSATNDAAEPEAATNETEDADAAVETKPKKSRKKILISAVAALLLASGGGGAYFFLSKGEAEPAPEAVEVPAAEALVDVEPMTVNLREPSGATRFLKVHLMLVPGEKTKEEITERLPLIIDAYQPFLRELRPEDLAGSAATFRLKEEMLIRANSVLGPKSVRDVLIQDLLQQ